MFCLVVWFGCPIVYSEVLLVSWCLHERQYFFIRQLLISHNLPLSNWISKAKNELPGFYILTNILSNSGSLRVHDVEIAILKNSIAEKFFVL